MNPARDAVDEANAAIGAAISTQSLPGDLEDLLGDIQQDLLDLADALTTGASPPPPDRLQKVLAGAHTAEPPRGFAVLGGLSPGGGLLKLARTVVRRAAHTAARGPVRDYLDLLADVLLTAAFRAEEHERGQVPLGLCIDVVRPTERSY
ncbi:ATP:cob(I)alamin adenosyltransferase [Amycolatopsis sp. K13G38]|uniref:ATP:cob(I)alamin adenosyltransferase n=1 Tax=Amycolatopsis acididurans TaxID=2724524 RepID=A0ABX1J9N3_9PSEU|nr:ATP:cob(I)alamin adenosyltransferase [Amycolatopsis acididurans]NKQ56006.1 ATP:cob(I)alamin adenosyltransferase [Amycolatopsis acididurans]